MIEPPVWIAIGTLLATVIGLTISSLKIWFNNRANQQGIKILSDLLELNREELKIYQKQVEEMIKNTPYNMHLKKEKFDLEKKKHEARENWKKFEAGLKLLELITHSDEE
jgi:hypothetical protein